MPSRIAGILAGVPAAAADATFVGISALLTSGAISWPGGTAAGDLAVLVGCRNCAVSCTGFTNVAGTTFESPSLNSFSYKVLLAGDISSPPTPTYPSVGAIYVVVYRGATVLAQKSANTGTGSTVVVTGFTKAVGSKMVIATAHDSRPGRCLGCAHRVQQPRGCGVNLLRPRCL